jgi:hypothetical protein
MKPKYVIARGQYYTVTADKGSHWEAYPVGGGLQHLIPKADAVVAQKLPALMVDCWARIEDGEAFPCRTNPLHRWNGWACPEFTKGQAINILHSWGAVVEHLGKDSITFRFKDNEEDYFVSKNSDGFWEFDGFCWNIETKEGLCIYSDGSVEERKDD